MANTSTLSKEERKKSKRASRKKTKAEKPKKPRDYARGSKKTQSEEAGARPGEAIEQHLPRSPLDFARRS